MKISHFSTTCLAAMLALLPAGGAAQPGRPARAMPAPAAGEARDIVVSGRRALPRGIAPLTIEGAFNVVGFAGAETNEGGALSIDEGGVALAGGGRRRAVPLHAIRAFAVERANKGLMRGTKGMIASFAPQGIGQVYSLFRPGAAMLTMFYTDEDQGQHGAVVMLPAGRADAVVRALTDAGIAPVRSPASGAAAAVRPKIGGTTPATGANRAELQVGMPAVDADDVPVAYVASTYEALVEQLGRRARSYRVFRQGDLRADPAGLLLSTTITGYRKGNAGLRGAVPVVGAIAGTTSITAAIRLTAPDGDVLFEDSSKGARLLPGESIGATVGLAKKVSAKLEKAGAGGTEVASR